MTALPAAGARRSIWLWAAAWFAAACIAILIFWLDLERTDWAGDLSIAHQALWGRDFVNVYTSGSLVLNDRLDILYDIEAYRAYQLELFDQGLKHHNYSYPPVTLLYTWLLALPPYPAALALWLGGTGAFFVWAARPYLRGAGLPAWVAILAPASIVNAWAGHYGFLIGGLWLAAFHFLPRRPVLAGILIGCMIVKPHLAILAPIVLLYRREWRAFAAAACTVILLSGLSILFFGPDLWTIYLTETAMVQAAMVDDVRTFFIRMMPTIMPSLALAGAGAAVSAAVQVVVALSAIGLLLWRMPKDSEEAGLATATATFLVLPYAFNYDMTVAGLAGLLVLQRSRSGGSIAFTLAAAFAFLVPMSVMYFGLVDIPVGPPALIFQLLALLGLIAPPAAAPARK
ncbi:MAG TPA: glycosyltransferase family 87 protein [Allosphingosinicella sp.]